jgi:hypothetical protein
VATEFNETEINGELHVDSAADSLTRTDEYNGQVADGSVYTSWPAGNIQSNGRSNATGFPKYQSPTVTLLQKKRGEDMTLTSFHRPHINAVTVQSFIEHVF